MPESSRPCSRRKASSGLPTRHASHENFRIFQAASLDGDFSGLLKCIRGKSAQKNDSSLLGCILVPLECHISTDASRECAYSTNLERSDLAARVSLKGPSRGQERTKDRVISEAALRCSQSSGLIETVLTRWRYQKGLRSSPVASTCAG